MASSAVQAQQLTVARSGTEIVHSIDFDVAQGRVTGLLGPSGCGKTTVIRAVAGVQSIAGGSLVVLGKPAGDPGLRRSIGYAAQTAAVYSDLTVAENVAYFSAVLGGPDGDPERVLDLVDLDRWRGRVVGRLSGGQRSRVSLAIALLGSPELLLLDEPTVGLDPVLREQLWSTFAGLARGGLTLLVSSHVMDEAARCDDLLLMRDGRLLAQDTPDGLLHRTSADTLEDAFLRLIKASGQDGAAA